MERDNSLPVVLLSRPESTLKCSLHTHLDLTVGPVLVRDGMQALLKTQRGTLRSWQYETSFVKHHVTPMLLAACRKQSTEPQSSDAPTSASKNTSPSLLRLLDLLVHRCLRR